MAASPERILIWGAGGHGKVVADLVRACGHTLVGFVDGDPGKRGALVEPGGGRVIAGEEELLEALRSQRLPESATRVVVAVGGNALRQELTRRLGRARAPALVHPRAVVSPSARIGEATVVFAGAIVNADARVGSAVIVNSGAIVEHDCRVGDGAHLSPGAVLGGAVVIGERSWVGAGATIIQCRAVGSDAVVGAGAVVIRDVDEGITVVGNPARPLVSPQAGSQTA